MKINEISRMTQNIILNNIKQSVNSFFNFDIEQFEICYHEKIKYEIDSKNKNGWKYKSSFNKEHFHKINALAIINNTSNTLSISCIYSKNGIKKYTLIIKGNTAYLLKILDKIKCDHENINTTINNYFKFVNVLDDSESIQSENSDIVLAGTMNIEFTKHSGAFNCSNIIFQGTKFESNSYNNGSMHNIISAPTTHGSSNVLFGVIRNYLLLKNYDFNLILENNMYTKFESKIISDAQERYPYMPNFLSYLNNNDLDKIIKLFEMIKY